MLILTRKPGQGICIPHLGLTVEVRQIVGKTVQLGISGPRDVRVLRNELLDREGVGGMNVSEQSLTEKQSVLLKSENAILPPVLHDVLNTVQTTPEPRIIRNPEDAEFSVTRLKRVLIVEDNQKERRLLASFLRMRDFEVEVAEDGEKAMASLDKRSPPDFVLLDMKMPRFDGRWTIDQIRRSDKLCRLRVFGLCGTDPREFGVSLGPGGIDGWFAKPVDPSTLAQELYKEAANSDRSVSSRAEPEHSTLCS